MTKIITIKDKLTRILTVISPSHMNRSSTGTFNTPISGLSPDTPYHYRDKVIGDGTSYGDDQQFITFSGSSPTLYEYYPASNDCSDVIDNIWSAQTFTPSTSHTVKQIKLKLQRVGTASGDFTVSLRDTSSGMPTGSDLNGISASLAASSIGTGSFVEYTFDLGSGVSLSSSHTYAIVFRAPGMSGSNSIYYMMDTAGGYGGSGNCQWASSNSGSSWFSHESWDIWFEEWGTT